MKSQINNYKGDGSLADVFDGSYVVQVTDGYAQLGKKKFKDLNKAKAWGEQYGRKHKNGDKFTVTIVKDYYHTVYNKTIR